MGDDDDDLRDWRPKRRRMSGIELTWCPPTPSTFSGSRDKRSLTPMIPDSPSSQKLRLRILQEVFVTLVTKDPVILAFHSHDVCFSVADRYLVAYVFVYFWRCRLDPEEVTRYNYFLALYLAHDILEENDESKWEILPWAIGRNWHFHVAKFHRHRMEFFSRMNFRACVSKKTCEQIFVIESFKELNIFKRVRNVDHGCILEKRRSKFERTYYIPYGPLWHYRNSNLEVKPSKKNDERALGRPCKVCGSRPFFNEEMRKLCLEIKSMDGGDKNVLDLSEGLDLCSVGDEASDEERNGDSAVPSTRDTTGQKVPSISVAPSSGRSSPMFSHSSDDEPDCRKFDYSHLVMACKSTKKLCSPMWGT